MNKARRWRAIDVAQLGKVAAWGRAGEGHRVCCAENHVWLDDTAAYRGAWGEELLWVFDGFRACGVYRDCGVE